MELEETGIRYGEFGFYFFYYKNLGTGFFKRESSFPLLFEKQRELVKKSKTQFCEAAKSVENGLVDFRKCTKLAIFP